MNEILKLTENGETGPESVHMVEFHACLCIFLYPFLTCFGLEHPVISTLKIHKIRFHQQNFEKSNSNGKVFEVFCVYISNIFRDWKMRKWKGNVLAQTLILLFQIEVACIFVFVLLQ